MPHNIFIIQTLQQDPFLKQFCLEDMYSCSSDYLWYPYYPEYQDYCYQNVISRDNTELSPADNIKWLGCIIAATVITFPLMYRNARAAFEQIDVNLVYAGRTLGMSETQIFWKVVVPTAGPGIASGTILTFARALGEYGATSMLAGNIPGKTGTISQKIAMVIQDGDYLTAGIWVAIVILIALVIIVLMNLISGKKMKNIKRW